METILFLAVSAIVMLCVKLWHQGTVIDKLIAFQNSQVVANKSAAQAIVMIATRVDEHALSLAAVGDYIAHKEGLDSAQTHHSNSKLLD